MQGNCDSCHSCDEDCCCVVVGFVMCVQPPSEICTPAAGECFPVDCRILGPIKYGWDAPPACILARLREGESLTYIVTPHGCNESGGIVVEDVDDALDCMDCAPIDRCDWAELPYECGNCYPPICLIIKAGTRILARCHACPGDFCDIPCDRPSSSSSSSGGASGGGSSNSSGSSSGGSSSSGGGGGGSSSSSSSGSGSSSGGSSSSGSGSGDPGGGSSSSSSGSSSASSGSSSPSSDGSSSASSDGSSSGSENPLP